MRKTETMSATSQDVVCARNAELAAVQQELIVMHQFNSKNGFLSIYKDYLKSKRNRSEAFVKTNELHSYLFGSPRFGSFDEFVQIISSKNLA